MVYLGRNRRQKLSKKQTKALKKEQSFKFAQRTNEPAAEVKPTIKTKIEIPKIITVRKFAEITGKPITEIIKKLMNSGIMASINESIDFDSAAIVADDMGFEAVPLVQKEEKKEIKHTNLSSRSPIVVVLGHVDHGKTTLLDAIRKTDIVSTESGGITQHIGAYQVVWKDKKNQKKPITFLDTPGHEAFSAMRAHGTNITDVAILVVAADDGVMPQTKEAISHIKAANVPVIVAINKIDKPDANAEKVERELADLGLVPEKWGGNTIMVPVSAKNKIGIDSLLDMVMLVSEMQDLKAQFDGKAEAVVIESHMQQGVGPVATILIKHGTLRKGDALLIGNKVIAKVKYMVDFTGANIDKAVPSSPVRIAGLSDIPQFGDQVVQVSNEREAKNRINLNSKKSKIINLHKFSDAIKSGELKTLSIILKADTQGSLEAIKNTLEQLSSVKIKIKIISSGVGSVNENDINLSIATNALILGFKIKVSEQINSMAKEKNIKIENYDIIYRLIEDIQKALVGMIEPEKIKVIIGKLQVLKMFYKTHDRKVIGGKVIDGKLNEGDNINIYHSQEPVGKGKILSLHLEKNQVSQVTNGQECGLAISTKVGIKSGDLIEAYKEELVKE